MEARLADREMMAEGAGHSAGPREVTAAGEAEGVDAEVWIAAVST